MVNSTIFIFSFYFSMDIKFNTKTVLVERKPIHNIYILKTIVT